MFKARKVKTASGKTAVQVVTRVRRRTNIIKHLGSAGNQSELNNLLILAQSIIDEKELTKPLFPEVFKSPKHDLVSIDKLKVVGSKHTFAYDFLAKYYKLNGFENL